MKTHKALLQEARALLSAGWCQGISHQRDPSGRQPTKFCLLGSIRAACGVEDALAQAEFEAACWLSRDVAWHVGKTLGETTLGELAAVAGDFFPGATIVHFNDAKGRTQKEVLAILDQTIAGMP